MALPRVCRASARRPNRRGHRGDTRLHGAGTNRADESVDRFRSDLYAFGVTLYEMFTGSLPFTAADPMEWVHCHIARQPLPPEERPGDIPAPVSEIVMKLLAKTAEERYQTAAGAGARPSSLSRRVGGPAGALIPFPLGEQDAPDRLLIPEKLFGRGARSRPCSSPSTASSAAARRSS